MKDECQAGSGRIDGKDLWTLLAIAAIVFAAKFNTIALPFHWDELGAYISPAYWLSQAGLYRALPGLHPPETFFGHPFALYLTLAALFKTFGAYQITAHVFILAIATLGLWYTFLLGKLLQGRMVGAIAAIFLFLFPMYFAQAGIVTGDIVVASLGVATVYYALRKKNLPYVVFATILLLTKESAMAIVASIIAYLLITDPSTRNWKTMAVYCAPIAPFIAFFAAQKATTGHFLPNPYFNHNSFAEFGFEEAFRNFKNVVYFGFYMQYRVVLFAAILLNFAVYRSRAFRREHLLFLFLFASFIGAYTFIYYIGRYILPVLPYFAIMAAASIVMLARTRAAAALAAALIIALFITRIHGRDDGCLSCEADLQYTDIVKVHKEASVFLEENYTGKRVLTNWPLYHAFTRPYLGYVDNPLEAVFFESADRTGPEDYDIIAYTPQSIDSRAGLKELVEREGLVFARAFLRNGKTVEVYVRPE
ncbi:MAG: glycosyltransferase family 39 protein [Deltaproteobacteria bacterium]|nr:glycosyltransferase family 39 protein [Deltaproteobacteria bacterium]MCL4873627.1 glycosyltransferase family 39 protein [bacterium]